LLFSRRLVGDGVGKRSPCCAQGGENPLANNGEVGDEGPVHSEADQSSSLADSRSEFEGTTPKRNKRYFTLLF